MKRTAPPTPQQLATELEEIIRRAEIDRGAEWFKAIEREHPIVGYALRMALSGTPEQAVERLAQVNKPLAETIKTIPGALNTIGKIQAKIRSKM